MFRKFKDKTCIVCSGIYTPTSPKQKFCLGCKQEATKIAQVERDKKRHNKKQKDKILLTKECLACGKNFSTCYQNKKYCGDTKCEDFRVKLKNKIAHKKRDKQYMLEKGRKYYNNNKEKCRIQAAKKYREKNTTAKVYVPRGKHKNTYKDVKSYIEERDYKLISKKYVNCKTKLLLECPEGHSWKTSFHNFRDNGGVIGNRCATCYRQNKYVSKPEQLIRCFVEDNFPELKVWYNDRSIIGPQELDFYFPDNNLAVEVCGLYWHGELASGKDKNYHYNKMEKCRKKGIRLITVFEDELHNQKETVFSRIKQALVKPSRIISARKCVVRVLDSKTTNKFYKNNHIYDIPTVLVRYGLFFKNELVCIGSLAKIDREQTITNKTIELKRFCTLSDASVVGGAAKLFKIMKSFAKDNNYTSIKSYCDMRYANIFKPMYEVLGFELTHYTEYTYHYFKLQKRYTNYSLRKTPTEILTGKTEWQLRQEQGYDRIWDCGHRTYTCIIN